MIEVENLTKRYGDKLAVDGVNFTVEPGVVTGFLGPNGAGKSTTMRMIAGLDAPTHGRVRVNGRDFRGSRAPMAELGVLLETRSMHTGRSARNHLRVLGQTSGIGRRRVDEVLELVGLTPVAGQLVGRFSLGMTQRLGIGAALLGSPRTIMLDEPVNGLDPDGVRWVRTMLRELANEGRTVLLSSHLMAEMAQTASRLIVLGRGRIVADDTMEHFINRTAGAWVRVRTPDTARLRALLLAPGVTVREDGAGVLDVAGLSCEQIGAAAATAGVAVHGLAAAPASLEDAFMSVTRGSLEFPAEPFEETVR